LHDANGKTDGPRNVGREEGAEIVQQKLGDSDIVSLAEKHEALRPKLSQGEDHA